MAKSKHPPQSQEEMVARALNEQGFLFSQRVRELIQHGHEGIPRQTVWAYEEKEYPVTASNGSQTRIDIVLRNVRHKGVYLCLECKRAHPDYKQWVFFDKDYGIRRNQRKFFFQRFSVPGRPIRPEIHCTHRIQACPAPTSFPIFDSYLEVAINRERKASHTETIEDALLQVMEGHTGLMAKILIDFTDFEFCSVPIVVTTAQLFDAIFDIRKVTLGSGIIDPTDLKLQPMDYCAVTYHPNDDLAIRSPHIHRMNGRASVQEDIDNWLTRTVFIVQSEKIIHFLAWLHVTFFDESTILS